MNARRLLLSLTIAGLWLVLPACRSSIDLTEEGILLGELQTGGVESLSLEVVMPWFDDQEGGESRFIVLSGSRKGSVLGVRHIGESEGHWRLVWHDADSGGLIEEQTLRRDDNGAVRLGPIVKHDRGLVVEMDERPVVVPAQLRSDAPIESSFAMRLPLIGNPDQLRGQGTGAVRVELAGRQRIRTVNGPVEALVVREVFTTDLNISSSRRETERWYVEGEGMVLEKWSETVKAFGLVIERSNRTIIRSN